MDPFHCAALQFRRSCFPSAALTLVLLSETSSPGRGCVDALPVPSPGVGERSKRGKAWKVISNLEASPGSQRSQSCF